MSEPDFIAESDEELFGDERVAWVRARLEEAGALGITWTRRSIGPDGKFRMLFEGWKIHPLDEGTPRFRPRSTA